LLGFGRQRRLRQILVGENSQHAGLTLSRAGINAGHAALGYIAGLEDSVHQAGQPVVLG
jgi:hypothetical protein